MKTITLILISLMLHCLVIGQNILTNNKTMAAFDIIESIIYVDSAEKQTVIRSALLLQQDIEMITSKKLRITNSIDKPYKNIIAIGTKENSTFLKQLIALKKVNVDFLNGKWEAFQIQLVLSPFDLVNNVLVIAGSDRRGTAFGVLELSKQMGISPWYWWADVPVRKQANLYVQKKVLIKDAPNVKYRGIFINDEAPALSNWSKEKFGGFNHQFYENVFELMLRLKANYIWPAMWGNAFYDDDSLNIKTADEYGIVIGTSHHEPLMRAHDEWRRYGNGQKWNYDSTENGLKEFWRDGMKRAWNEKMVSVGMRGDGDEPMSRETATSLLERIVADQRKIIADVSGKPANETPQLWALYKEVQDYYDKGMNVPDDVTLLLCDDNWGNIRKLPKPDYKPRAGGYGIYYHFDYVGGPRNYKWLNTNPLPRIWEQMHLAWEYNAKQIWIVNVGDIKPMEFPISFFLDYAWNPEKIGADDLKQYAEQWATTQFGTKYAKQIAEIIGLYSKYNARRKPELLDADTYSFNYNEWPTVVREYNELLKRAEEINSQLSAEYKSAYFQLVLHPVKACANLYNLYYNVALNKQAFANRWEEANAYADKVKQLYVNDSLITLQYHQMNNGKWNQMMSQTHIGYTYWQQPAVQKMPEVRYIPQDLTVTHKLGLPDVMRATVPTNITGNAFFQEEHLGVSIEANHFSNATNTGNITWKTLPDLGRTGSAITTFPVTAKEQELTANTPHVEYEIYTYSKGEFTINAYFSPTLNFNSTAKGLQYAISVDEEEPQIISLNKEDKTSDKGVWNKWAAENINIKSSKHSIAAAGKHTVKYWMVNSAVVLQKLVLDFGDLKPSYLGPPETIIANNK